MAYLPIEDHGLIGDMRTAALVGRDGTIDWLCLPRFDAPSVFAGLLDHRRGGHFRVGPPGDGLSCRQLYWPDTNVLVTRFLCDDGVAELIDYMPVGDGREESVLVRRLEVVRGEMVVAADCRPAFDYGRADHETTMAEHGAAFRSDALMLGLSANVALEHTDGGGVGFERRFAAGDRAVFALRVLDGEAPPPIGVDEERRLFNATIAFWRRWIARCTYEGRWREQVYRSALALKLLTYEPTGAMVAAPTCSLPERIGGERNWDYRYTWVRDAAFTVYAFLRIGFTEEAAAFMDWLRERCRETSRGDGPLQVLYGIDGRTEVGEQTLDHLDGYRGSRPVRIGNDAYDQRQLDIYGELFDAVYLYNKYRSPIGYDFWEILSDEADWVADHWQEPDVGLWEFRSEPRHFVYSKLMCWVALDRALRLADKRSFPAPHQRWREARDAIYRDVMARGWSEQRGAFVQHYDGEALDASACIKPLVFFVAPDDPRMLRTLDAICRAPEEGGLLYDTLVYRYDPERSDDGFGTDEGTFNMCTFWLVEALTRAGRTRPDRLRTARLVFEKMLGYANHLGLYAEETGARGEALGNFPQAFTHLALISAAYNLDRTLDGRRYGQLG